MPCHSSGFAAASAAGHLFWHCQIGVVYFLRRFAVPSSITRRKEGPLILVLVATLVAEIGLAEMGAVGAGDERPQHVGILAADVYFPSTFVAQEDLEVANGVSPGKYTIGLGQDAMAFTGDREDINSICLTVVAQLLEKYDVPKTQIGRIEVGTETLIDKSKSTKTVLMSLFDGSGNTDIEGVTTINACYGGTAALLNALAWVESSGWDGRYAIVVAADIAVYAEGPARPTGGCGAVALLVGPDAPLVINQRTRASFACDVWDFFKPDMTSEYPQVNGQLSQVCYLRALDSCYNALVEKRERQRSRTVAAAEAEAKTATSAVRSEERSPFTLKDVQHVLCHSPYNKLVQKSFARMVFSDARRLHEAGEALDENESRLQEALEKWVKMPLEATYDDRELEKVLKTFAGVSTDAYCSMVEPGCRLSKQIGNTYAASVFANIVCLIDAHGVSLEGQTALVFSYGSGAMATMYELEFRDAKARPETAPASFTVKRIAKAVDLKARLADREKLTPEELDAALAARSAAHDVGHAEGAGEGIAFVPKYPADRLFPGTFFLESVGADRTRSYKRHPKETPRVRGGALAPPVSAKDSIGNGVSNGGSREDESGVEKEGNHAEGESVSGNGHVATEVSITEVSTSICSLRDGEDGVDTEEEGDTHANDSEVAVPSKILDMSPMNGSARVLKLASSSKEVSSSQSATSSKTAITNGALGVSNGKASVADRLGSGLPRIVVTGVACGLPGQPKVFEEDNLARLLSGQDCLEKLSNSSIAALVEKNVVQVQRLPNSQPPLRIPISKPSQTIKVAARLGSLDMGIYGVSPSIAATMDKAVKVAVVAGLEALKDAGIVTGEGQEGWMLPGHMRDSTGVMYASSYPALDAAIGEVMRFLRSRCITRAKKGQLVAALRQRLQAVSPTGQVSSEDEDALQGLEKAVMTKSVMNLGALVKAEDSEIPGHNDPDRAAQDVEQVIRYEFDRKFLFRVLVLGNAQLAQLIGARGPNMQTNAACAGSTLAFAMAQDIMQVGRCERMVVIAGDDASGDALLPWIGNGFRALGAASIASEPSEAALPFDARRNGMLVGAGGIGMVLETEAAAARRHCEAVGIRASQPPPAGGGLKARLLETQISNSAYHGASMDKHHIAIEIERFLTAIKRNWGITREQIAKEGVYFSHETSTHATPMASCSFNEISALRKCFGDELMAELIIVNTKGFTGHPMGVSFEDVAAVEVLHRGIIPPTANNPSVDPVLGKIRLSAGGKYSAKYAMRFAAGFGSQVALALYSTIDAVPLEA